MQVSGAVKPFHYARLHRVSSGARRENREGRRRCERARISAFEMEMHPKIPATPPSRRFISMRCSRHSRAGLGNPLPSARSRPTTPPLFRNSAPQTPSPRTLYRTLFCTGVHNSLRKCKCHLLKIRNFQNLQLPSFKNFKGDLTLPSDLRSRET